MVARCQCDPNCKNEPLPNSPFCKKHNKRCTRKASLSGYEIPYSPDKYNNYNGIKESHNCFMYAVYDHINLPSKKCTLKDCQLPFAQPGRISGYPTWERVKGKRCPDIIGRTLGDVPDTTLSSFTGKCPKGTRKVATVVDPKNDYHWYRQDADGYWSHKPGSTPVTNVDSTGRRIYDPQLASRHSSGSDLNYNKFCGYLCIPVRKKRMKRGGKRGSKRTKKNK